MRDRDESNHAQLNLNLVSKPSKRAYNSLSKLLPARVTNERQWYLACLRKTKRPRTIHFEYFGVCLAMDAGVVHDHNSVFFACRVARMMV